MEQIAQKVNVRSKTPLAAALTAALLSPFGTSQAATDDIPIVPKNIYEEQDADNLKWAIISDPGFHKPIAELGDILGFAWAAGSNSNVVGEDLDIYQASGDKSHYILKGRYNKDDPYADGYRASETLKIDITNIRFINELDTLKLGEIKTYDLELLNQTYDYVCNHGSAEDTEILETTYDTQQNWSKTENYSFSESIGLTQSYTINTGFFGGTTNQLSISFNATQGWSDTKGGSQASSVKSRYSATVPAKTKREIVKSIYRSKAEIPYSFDAYIDYDLTYENFLRWSGNARTDHPTDRPWERYTFGEGDGLNAGEDILDQYIHRQINGNSRWDWNWVIGQYGSDDVRKILANVVKKKFGASFAGKFSLDAVFIKTTAGKTIPLTEAELADGSCVGKNGTGLSPVPSGFVSNMKTEVIKPINTSYSPTVNKEEESTLTSYATTFKDPRYGDAYLNSMSFSQDALISYKGWQYAAYYDYKHRVVLKRRQLPNGPWEAITFTDYIQTEKDNHNIVSIGISPSDGRIHLAFDQHDSNLHYRLSTADVANNPSGFSWDDSLFGAIQDNLDNDTIASLSYPRFITAPDGTLIFEGRIGESGNGESWLWQYDNDGSWTQKGKFIENSYNGGDANAYFFGIEYDKNNRLHATWVWRENFGGNSNHDIMYAYSDDHGGTWHNNAGKEVAITGSSFITLDTDVKVWDIPADNGLINQESMAVDQQGRVHVLARRDIDGVNKQMHYWRDAKGHWTQTDTGINTKIWANRSKIAYDKDGNVYAVMPNIQIASASAKSNYSDWTVINIDDNGQFSHSEPLIDSYGLKEGNDNLYVFAQKGALNTTSGIISVSKYSLNGTAFKGWTMCANEGQQCKFSGTRTVRYGANGSYTSATFTDMATCDNATFGDPAQGAEKVCEVSETEL